MKLNIKLLLLIAIANSAHAISFRYYYKGWKGSKGQIELDVRNGTLNLAGKKLTDLDGFDEVPNLANLRTLDLSNNQLTEIPASIGNLPRLQYLILRHNQLTTLPETIGELTNLTYLDLSHNKIESIPADIGALSKVRVLSLNHNLLSTIPEEMGGMSDLVGLRLENNHLTTIPATIGNLHWLRTLRLENNELTSIPETIGQLPWRGDLTALYLYNNPIPLTKAQLRTRLRLAENTASQNFKLYFKSQQQERAEHDLFQAIKDGNVSKVGFRYKYILIGAVSGPYDDDLQNFAPIDVAKIRDADGNNLMHAAIQSAYDQLQPLKKHISAIMSNAELTNAQKKEQVEPFLTQIDEINDRYMKIMSILLSCGEGCVQTMLFTPNAQGQQVIEAIIAHLGFDSPIYKAILEGLASEEEEKKEAAEEEETARWHAEADSIC